MNASSLRNGSTAPGPDWPLVAMNGAHGHRLGTDGRQRRGSPARLPRGPGVLGTDYVDANLAGADEFMMGFQRLLTEWAWGYAWSRPGLDTKTRSMLNLAILTALGRPQELGIYVKGALSTGVSVAEIQEVLLHATVYCGTPAGRQAFLAAHEALEAEGALEPAL